MLYLYDLNGQLLAEADAQGTVTKAYAYMNGEPLAQIDAPQNLVYYYHTDHLGTPQVLTDQSQDVVWKANYAPFGDAQITVDTVTNNLRFPGQYADSETGLHYNYFRYYDSATGRYITSDPIGLNGGLNTYAYAENSPIYLLDPFGLRGRRGVGRKKTPWDGSGPFGGMCGPEGSVLATWIPDIAPDACDQHDRCYESCAMRCMGESCKLTCDVILGTSSLGYGYATAAAGGRTYDGLKKKYGCDDKCK